MRLLALIPDAFGGRGGIAKFNRDLLESLCLHPDVEEVVAIPRVIVDEVGELPDQLYFDQPAATGMLRFLAAVLKHVLLGRPVGGVVCGHINLLPVAALAAMCCRAPLLMVAHGIEAWTPPGSVVRAAAVRLLSQRVDAIVTVSALTLRRIGDWMSLDRARSHVVPNCIDRSLFGPGPKSAELLTRYGLRDRTVLLTLARLSSSERYKGIDEVIEALPGLAEHIPNIAYLVCGDGDDRDRLQRKANSLGVGDRVEFAGYIPEPEKADHYRLADAFVMPGRGEGFGIVYLEALACGVPVVASIADASQEAVLDGAMGIVVDPDDPSDVQHGILRSLRRPRIVPQQLDYFSHDRFRERWHNVIEDVFLATRDVQEQVPVPLIQAPSR